MSRQFREELDAAALQQAQALTAQFKAGNWQAPITRMIPEGAPRLKLGAITVGAKNSLVTINGKALAEREGATISIKLAGGLRIKCLKIEKDSVVIAVEGEDTPRLLQIK
jgi:hypothetical protein